MTVLPDQSQRDRIDRDLDTNLFVEAGAGSGKTSKLVDRILTLILSGRVSLEQISAITFTIKAANELKSRLRDKFNPQSSASTATKTTKFTDQQLRELSSQLDLANIGTIHSFCLNFLKHYWVQAQVPPNLKIMSSERRLEYSSQFHSEIRTHLETERVTSQLNYFYSAPDLKFTPQKLFELISQLDQNILTFRNWMPSDNLAVPSGNTPDSSGIIQQKFEQVLEAILELLLSAHQDRVDKGEITEDDVILKTYRFLQSLTSSETFGDRAVLDQIRSDYPCLLVDEFQDTDSLQLAIFRMIVGATGNLFVVGDPKQAIFHFRGGDLSTYSSAKLQWPSADMVNLAVNFRSSESIINFVNYIFSHSGAVSLPTGLFDHNLYGAEAGRAATDYVPLLPPQSGNNQGTEAGIDVEIIEGDITQGNYAVTPASTDGVEAPNSPLKIDYLRAIEAESVAGCIKEYVTSTPRGEKPQVYGDIAVLFQNKSNLPHLISAFSQANIPYITETRISMFEVQEVIDLITFLKFIDSSDPENYIPLLLRSTLYGVSDTELLTYRNIFDHPNWSDSISESLTLEAPSQQIYDTVKSLYGWRENAWALSIDQLLEQIIAERHLFAIQDEFANRAATVHGIGTLLKIARRWVNETHGSRKDFLAYLTELEANRSRDKEIILETTNSDAVTLTNFHQSKGREWPVVIVAGAGTADSRDHGDIKLISWKANTDGLDSVEVRLNKSVQTANFATALKAEKQIEIEERLRTYYVAFTRAQQKLVVTAHFWNNQKTRFGYQFTKKFLQGDLARETSTYAKLRHWTELVSRLKVNTSVNRQLPAEEKSLPSPDVSLKDMTLQSIFAVSSLETKDTLSKLVDQLLERVTPEFDDGLMIALDKDVYGKLDLPSFGNAVHRVLELSEIKELSSDELESLINLNFPNLTSIFSEKLSASVSTTLKSPIIQRARNSGRFFLELPLMMGTSNLPGSIKDKFSQREVLSGRSDLVFQNDDETWTIVDFKNTVADKDKFQKAQRNYLKQLVLYACLFESATGAKVSQLTLLYALGGPVEFTWKLGELE
jgi:ATP-dependent helicase/nuclease subunit A